MDMENASQAKAPRRGLSVGTKLSVVIVLIVAVAATIAGRALVEREANQLLESKRQVAYTLAEQVSLSAAPALEFDDPIAIEAAVTQAKFHPGLVHISFWRQDKAEPLRSFTDEAYVGDQSALEGDSSGLTIEVGGSIGQTVYATAPILEVEGARIGGLRVELSTEPEQEALAEATRLISLGAALAALLLVSLVLMFSRLLVIGPLQRIERAVARFGRKGELIDPSVRSRDELGSLARAVMDMAAAIDEREGRLEATNEQLQLMLDAMAQALFAFDRNGTLHARHSAATREIFGLEKDEVVRTNVRDLLIARAPEFSPEREALEMWIDAAFEMGQEGWDDFVDLAPRELVIDLDTDRQKELALDLRPIFDGDGALIQVVALVTDMSAQRAAERQVEDLQAKHAAEMEAMREAMQQGPFRVSQYFREAGRRLDRVEALLEASPGKRIGAPEIGEAFRHVHTVKGEARITGLPMLVREANAVEDLLAMVRTATSDDQIDARLPEIREALGSLRSTLRLALEDFRDNFPEGEVLLQQTAVPALAVERLRDHAPQIGDPVLRAIVDELTALPTTQLLSGFQDQLPTWASSRGKRAVLRVKSELSFVPGRLAEPFRTALSHLLRNAVAHGIEREDERRALSKAVPAPVEVTVSGGPSAPTVTVADDGRGFDREGLVQKASQAGTASSDQLAALTTVQLAAMPGVSLADKVDDISGRGVGLDAVVEELGSVGYWLRIESEAGSGARCIIEPRPSSES